jgi:hypothetical protein
MLSKARMELRGWGERAFLNKNKVIITETWKT